jgi:hypothetical protein
MVKNTSYNCPNVSTTDHVRIRASLLSATMAPEQRRMSALQQAGFENRKPTHGRANGSDPTVVLRMVIGEMAPVGPDLLDVVRARLAATRSAPRALSPAAPIGHHEGAPVSPLGQLYRCEGARLGRRYPAADLSRLDWMIVLSVARAFRDAMAEELARAMRAAWGWPSAGTWGTTSRAWWGRRWRWQGGSTMRDSEQRAPVAEDEHHDVAQRHDGRILALVAAFSDTSSLCECHRSRAPAASEQARCWPVRRARRRGGRRGPRLSPREADGLSLRGAQEPCAPAAGGAAREVLTDEYDAIEKLWGER